MLDQSRRFIFSPEDDTQKIFLDFVSTARQSIFIADYSFNLEPLVELLIQKKNEGVLVQLVLDKSQAGGSTEKPKIQELRDAGVQMMIGESSCRKIMHDKFCIIDKEWIEYGSWNFTGTASKENNFFAIEHNPDLANVFFNAWLNMWNWIKENIPQS